jgi:hypothetical protein
MKKSQNKNKHKDHRTTLLEWETPEFVPIPRSKVWYIVAGVIMGALITYALFSGNLTIAIVFIMIVVLFLLL